MILYRNTYLDASHNGRDYHEDLVDLFTFQRAGYRPLQLAGNWDMDERDLSFPLDPTWPGSIPNDQVTTMSYTIESGIEVPKRYKHSGKIKVVSEAMGQLELNQSFFIPSDDMTTNQISGLLCTARRNHPGKRFVSRKTVIPPTGMRIWRVE